MFLSGGIRAEDRSPYGNFWFEPVGVRTSAGIRVSADTAMTLSAVYRAIALVSGHMGLLPVIFYKAGTRQRIKTHPVLQLLNRRPNKWQNAFEWREMLQGHIELRGNAYNEIISDPRNGKILQLVPRHPDLVKVEVTPDGDYRYRITNPDGSTRIVPRGNIWHIRGLSSDGIVGLSVLEHARESFGLGLAAQSYGARFFANDAKPTGGWIEFPGSYKDKSQKDAVRETLIDAQAGMNRGKLMILDHGMKYNEVGPTNEDMQFLDTRKFSVDDIARWFGVPPHKIGSLDRSTNNNIEQQALEYITDGLLARATRWQFAIKEDLLFDDEDIDIEYDFKVLMRADSTSRSNYLKNMTLGGILLRNEARDVEGYDPLPGLDRPLIPLNMVEEPQEDNPDDPAGNGAPAKPAQPADSAPGQQQTDEAGSRLAAMVRANAARLARRFVKAGAIDADLIAEAFALDPAVVYAFVLNPANAGIETEQQLTAALIALGSQLAN